MLTGTLVLAPGVVIFPVDQLPASVRPMVREDDRFALTRVTSRGTTKLLDEPTASLLERLREPGTLVDAVVAVAEELHLDPHLFLEDAFATATRLLAEGVLLPGADGTAEPSHSLGDSLGAFTLERQVQDLDDISVFRAIGPGARPVALKMACGPAPNDQRELLAREARILERLGGSCCAPLVFDGTDADVPYLALEWIEGQSATAWAADVRKPWSRTARDELYDGVVSIADAYAELHRRGVVHADVHPRNLLVSRRGATILDFSLSVVPDDHELATARRGGVLPFYEPEWAAAALRSRAYPTATEQSDQYSLGAVLYSLFTGHSYLGPQADRRTTLRRITSAEPWPFHLYGLPSWPEVETVLARAMAKDPAARFDSMRDLATALREAVDTRGAHRRSLTARRLADEVEQRLGRDGGLVDCGLPAPPYVSVNYGAAGVAYYWYRLGVLRQDPAHLRTGMRWVDYAIRTESSPDAYGNRDIGITASSVGSHGLYHSPSGLHCVTALLHNAMGDVEGAAQAADRFIGAARGAPDRLDVVSGRSGGLIGAALLCEALGPSNRAAPALRQFADAELGSIWSALEGSSLASGLLRYWGIAHGWAGVLFATARWSEASGAPQPGDALERTAELAAAARSDHDRLWWAGPNDPPLVSSWCHGSAGYVHLWSTLSRVTGEPAHAARALGAAEHCWSAATLNENLCCGAAGQGYAMLVAYQLTGDDRWLGRAHELAERSLEWLGNAWTHPNALYKGDLGIALLMEDLADPTGAAMPLFSPEGWPN